MENYQLQRIMRTAWFLEKNNGFTKSEGLKQSWLIFQIRAKLTAGPTTFSYRKADGSVRKAVGTFPSKSFADKSFEGPSGIKKSQLYYDIEVDDWRQFRIANLLG